MPPTGASNECQGGEQLGSSRAQRAATVPHCHACLHYWCPILSTRPHVVCQPSKASMVAVAGVCILVTLGSCGHEGKPLSRVPSGCVPLRSAPSRAKSLGRPSHCSVVGGDGLPAAAGGALLRDSLCQARHCSSPKQKTEKQKTPGGCCRLMLVLC